MSIDIRISSKGQIVIPKDVRDALELEAGGTLRLTRHGKRIILEVPVPDRPKISYAEFRKRIPRYEGPPVAAEEMTSRVDTLFRDWQA